MIGNLFQTRARKSASRPAPSARPRLETLEDRWVPATLTVNDDGGAMFTSIQSAVNAANAGDTIKVQEGTYTEQVVFSAVKDNIKLQAQGSQANTKILAPANLTGSLVHINGADGVFVKGFTINGNGNANGTVDAGVLIDNNGSATIRNSRITGLYNNSNNQQGYGIRVTSGGESKILNNTIDNYQKGGIIVTGSTAAAIIQNNTVTGVANAPLVAQNGLQISDNANVYATSNTITNNNYQGSDFDATGILVFNQTRKSVIAHNTVTGNDVGGFIFEASNAYFLNNHFSCNSLQGVVLLDADSNTIRHNKVENNGSDGIALFDSSYNDIKWNLTAGNSGNGILVDNEFDGGGYNTLEFGWSNSNAANGILLINTTNNTLIFNASTCNVLDGIRLVNADNNTIRFNLSSFNGGAGIFLDANSTGNIIDHNVTIGNGDGGFVQETGVAGMNNTWLANQSTEENTANTLVDDVTE